MNFEVTELQKFLTEKITEIDTSESIMLSLGMLHDNETETISVPRSEKTVKLRLGAEDNGLFTNLGVFWRLLGHFWCPYPQASLNEETTERIKLSPGKDEVMGKSNLIDKLILPHQEEPKDRADKTRDEQPKKMERGTCLDLATGGDGHSCDGRSCVRIQSFQKKDLALWFGDVAEKEGVRYKL